MFLRQATASQTRSTPIFVDSTDFKTVKTGLTIANTDVKISANGGAQASKNSGGGTHLGNGSYALTFDATDTATVGDFEVTINVSGALPVFFRFTVVEEAVYDMLFGASAIGYIANQPVDVNTIKTNPVVNAGTVTFPTGATLASTTNITAGTITTVTTVTNQLTAAQIATGVWQDATAGDFTTSSSIGKALYIANIAPGASGGHMISGSNAGTTTFGALTVTGATTLTGAVTGTNASNDLRGILLQATQTGVTIPTVTTVTNQLTGAAIATAVWTDTTAGDFTTALSVGKSIMNGVSLGTGLTVAAVSGAVGSVTGAVGSVTGNVGGNVTGSVGSIASGGITTASFASGAINAAAIAADAIGASELATDAVAEIAAGVWDLATSGHTTSGTFGAAMNAAGSAGDPWATSLPGAYGAGAAGYILGTNLNATVSSRASQTSLDTVDDYVDTEIATIVTQTGAGAIRTALGLASANLDTQLDALPTNAELATALGTADDATLAAIAALSIPTAAQNAAALLDLANGIESSITLRQALRLILAASAGKISGAATTTIVIRNVGDSKDRITATVDADGNRSAVTTDAT